MVLPLTFPWVLKLYVTRRVLAPVSNLVALVRLVRIHRRDSVSTVQLVGRRRTVLRLVPCATRESTAMKEESHVKSAAKVHSNHKILSNLYNVKPVPVDIFKKIKVLLSAFH